MRQAGRRTGSESNGVVEGYLEWLSEESGAKVQAEIDTNDGMLTQCPERELRAVDARVGWPACRAVGSFAVSAGDTAVLSGTRFGLWNF